MTKNSTLDKQCKHWLFVDNTMLLTHSVGHSQIDTELCVHSTSCPHDLPSSAIVFGVCLCVCVSASSQVKIGRDWAHQEAHRDRGRERDREIESNCNSCYVTIDICWLYGTRGDTRRHAQWQSQHKIDWLRDTQDQFIISGTTRIVYCFYSRNCAHYRQRSSLFARSPPDTLDVDMSKCRKVEMPKRRNDDDTTKWSNDQIIKWQNDQSADGIWVWPRAPVWLIADWQLWQQMIGLITSS